MRRPRLTLRPLRRYIARRRSRLASIASSGDLPSWRSARMYDAAASILQQKLSRIGGVGQVVVGGSSLPAVRLDLNPIYEACVLRFRPIMMTTMAALLGALPLAVGGGTGSELRQFLGITIVGGLIVSQLLTLYTTPVVYLYLDRLSLRFKGLRQGRSRGTVPATSSLG